MARKGKNRGKNKKKNKKNNLAWDKNKEKEKLKKMQKKAMQCYQEAVSLWEKSMPHLSLKQLEEMRDELDKDNQFRKKIEKEIKKRRREKG
jgi:hypothetical protein